jgi:hypothetical protein
MEFIYEFTSLGQAQALVQRVLRASPGYVSSLRSIRECVQELVNAGKFFYPEYIY